MATKFEFKKNSAFDFKIIGKRATINNKKNSKSIEISYISILGNLLIYF